MLDTGGDIKQKKILTITAANQLKIIFGNKILTPRTKRQAFRPYFEPIFIYKPSVHSNGDS